jgi:hypothetical protein
VKTNKKSWLVLYSSDRNKIYITHVDVEVTKYEFYNFAGSENELNVFIFVFESAITQYEYSQISSNNL